jgi:hypothetical protein
MTFRLKLHGTVVGVTACTALLAGCGSSGGYYMVRDPGSATPYYTTGLVTSGSALQFNDAKTGNAVTLQSSEVRRISKEEFEQGMTAPVAAPVVLVPATVVAVPPVVTAPPAPSGAGASAPAAAPSAAPQAKPQ